MHHSVYTKTLSILLGILCLLVWSLPAAAMSIREENQLADEFIRIVKRHYEVIDDPQIVGTIDAVGRRLLAGLAPQPFSYNFHVIKEDVFNAFAMPAGFIFINSGLLLAMETEDELAGILAHEIGHVVARHISQRIARSKKIDLATMAGVVAGIFLGAASGSAGAAQALAIGSAAAGQTVALSFSREDESEADQLGLQYMTRAGYTPEGLLDVLKKIRARQWFGSQQIPTYMMTHPAVEDRIAHIDTWMAIQGDGLTQTQDALRKTDNFRRMQYRLRALYNDPRAATEYFKAALERNPSDRYLMHAYGLLLGRTGNRAGGLEQLQKALALDAMDPVVLGDLGKLYFLEGRLEEAQNILRSAVSLPNANPESWFYLGRTHTAQGNFPAAVTALETLLKRQEDYAPAYYFLGEAYGKWDRQPEAHYYLGLHHFSRAEDRTAHFHLTRAKSAIQDPAKIEVIDRKLELIGKLPKE
ncbi:MAG: M48 family metalloprotease [Desulfatitalea sp.]|nr:M48 family metalloprotease [Desulfatitalea sp.]